MYHPDVATTHAHDRQRDLIAQAQRRSLISAIRRHSRANPVARGRPTAASSPRGVYVAAAA